MTEICLAYSVGLAIVPRHSPPLSPLLMDTGAPFGYDTLRMAPLNCSWWHSR